MFDTVFAMGCSFVQGSELGPDNRNLPNFPVMSVPDRFSELVAEHYKAKHINIAQGGAGQSRIFRSTIDWLNGEEIVYPYWESFNEEPIPVPIFKPEDKILFLIGLSNPLRQEVWVNRMNKYEKWNIYSDSEIVERVTAGSGAIKFTNEEETLDFNKDYEKFKRFYLEHLHNEDECIKESFRLMSALKATIKDKAPRCEIFFFNALGDSYPESFSDGLKLDKKYLPSWESYAYNNKLMDLKFSHPKEKAHKELADHIISKYPIVKQKVTMKEYPHDTLKSYREDKESSGLMLEYKNRYKKQYPDFYNFINETQKKLYDSSSLDVTMGCDYGFYLHMTNQIIDHEYKHIIEYGPGFTTLLLHRIIQDLDYKVQVYSYEDSEKWFNNNKKIGVDVFGTMELVKMDTELKDDKIYCEYKHSIDKHRDVDCIIIDGPGPIVIDGKGYPIITTNADLLENVLDREIPVLIEGRHFTQEYYKVNYKDRK